MVPALEHTLTDLGIDLRSQENVHLDLDVRPSKSPRAFCAPIEVPGKVMLVIQPIGGKDDWEALFHEAGHTEHYANTDARPADGGAPARRHGGHRGLGDADAAPRHRARVAEPPPERAARRGARTRRRDLAPLLRAPLLGEAALRDRVLPGRGADGDAQPLRGDPRRRAEAARQPGELPRRHRRQLLRDRLSALMGVRGAAARLPAQRARQRLVREARRGRPAARAVVAGSRPDGRRAAAGRDGREARDGVRRGPHPPGSPNSHRTELRGRANHARSRRRQHAGTQPQQEEQQCANRQPPSRWQL